MGNPTESILNLKPVTFRYKEELDPDNLPQFGLVAEEVEKVNPDLVVRDWEWESYHGSLRSRERDVLNEFLKEHPKAEELKATVVKQENAIKLRPLVCKRSASKLT